MRWKPAIVAAIVIVIALGAVTFKWGLLDTVANGEYYTQIDNGKVHKLQSEGGVVDFTGGMKWEYELPAYDAEGVEKQLKFGTERQLREGAYLKLSVVPIQGVVAWEEVEFNQIPPEAQDELR